MVRLPSRRREEDSGDFSGRLTTILDPSGPASEAYRTLRTNLFYSIRDTPPKVITLTSPGPKEGKSTTCANLGVVMAQADKRTLILDCDLRRPVIHKVFALRNVHGLMNILAGEKSLQEVWHEPYRNLKVVTVGPMPTNPAEVLSSRRFTEFLASMRRDFDYVLVDAPPTRLVSDPAVIASQGDGVLLVLDAQKTRKRVLREAMRSLTSVDANVLGTVMNNVPGNKAAYYGGYTYG